MDMNNEVNLDDKTKTGTVSETTNKNKEIPKYDPSQIRVTFQDKYQVLITLGSGSFGEVYLIKDRFTEKIMAAKVESSKLRSRLFIEYMVYRHLTKGEPIVGIPKAYKYFQTREKNIMLMEQLGVSLDEAHESRGNRFSIGTTGLIGIQILKLIQQVHDKGIIHRDIKPNNFMMGLDDPEVVYMLDFGLSKKYINRVGNHVKQSYGRSLIGTPRYASINMHMGIEPSRRDDLESIGYMLVYFLRGSLPWQGIRKKRGKSDLDKIKDIKIRSTLSDTLTYGLPKQFSTYLDYCRGLSFDQRPDYKILIELMETVVAESGQDKLEWIGQES